MANLNQSYRALTKFESLPPGHATFFVGDDGSEPHLRVGEYGVVDTRDRELQHSELYLYQARFGRGNATSFKQVRGPRREAPNSQAILAACLKAY